MFFLERKYEIFINTTNYDFRIQQTPLEIAWKHAPQYVLSSQVKKKHATKYLNILHMYSITAITITQISKPNIFYPHKDAKFNFKASPKVIKEA